MIAGLFCLGWALLIAWTLTDRGVGDDGIMKGGIEMPLVVAVLIIVVGTAAGTFLVTRSVISHHWISN